MNNFNLLTLEMTKSNLHMLFRTACHQSMYSNSNFYHISGAINSNAATISLTSMKDCYKDWCQKSEQGKACPALLNVRVISGFLG